jgi:NAD(P)-dependent dehydrogenase (short-subunit alcohol dehydrogenase family)
VRLANKTAFITGGNSGIGLATAKLFVAEGARVAITGRNKETLEAAAKELGPNALAIVADATDIAATEAAIKQAVAKFGKLDVIFANAGIAGGTPLGAATLETFEKVIRTNITAVFFTVQAAVPHLNDGASIILNGSVISVLGNPGYSALRGEQGRRARDGAGDGVRTLATQYPRQRGLAGGHPHPDLGRCAGDAGSREGVREAHRGNYAARPHRRTRSHLKDGAVSGVGRFRPCAGPGIIRRWRRDGFSERRADLSGLRISNPVSAIG